MSITKITKSQFARQFAKTNNLSIEKSQKYINSFIEVMTQNLAEDKQVVFVGFGSFRKSKRKAKEGRHPRTGELIQIPESTTVSFTAGKSLKNSVEQGA